MSTRRAINITGSKIDAMESGEDMWDLKFPGLHVRAGARKKVFRYAYTTLQNQRRVLTIGDYGTETIETARDLARDLDRIIQSGGDPSTDKQFKKDAAPPATLKDLRAIWESDTNKALAKRRAEKEIMDRTQGSAYTDSGLHIIRREKKDRTDLKKHTVDLYKGYWKVIIEFFGENCIVNSIDEDRSFEFHEWAQEKREVEVTDKTGRVSMRVVGGHVNANRALTFLGSMMVMAMEKRVSMRDPVLKNPVSDISRFVEHKKKRHLQNNEQESFMQTCVAWLNHRNPYKRNTARLALLCLFTASRRGEFMYGRLRWIDWERAVIMIPDSKTEYWKEITIGEHAMPILLARKAEWERKGSNPEHDWIIPGKTPHKHMTAYKESWPKLLKAAGIKEYITMHGMRHSFASIVLSCGYGGLDQAGQILGHLNAETTLRYAHMMDDSKRKIINQVGSHLMSMIAPPPAQLAAPE